MISRFRARLCNIIFDCAVNEGIAFYACFLMSESESLSGPDPRSGKLLTDKNVSLQERVFSVLYCTFFSWVPLLSLTAASESLVLRVSTELQASMLGEVDSRPEWWLERRWADKHPHCILFLRRRDYSVPLGSSGGCLMYSGLGMVTWSLMNLKKIECQLPSHNTILYI